MCVCVRTALVPPTPGWVVLFRCVCLSSGFGCAPPLLAGVLGCACVCACSTCTPQLRAGVCGVGACAWARLLALPSHSWFGCWGVCVRAPIVPHHSWLGCALWVGVLALRFQLRPATPGWGVGVCVCLCARSCCTPPLLTGVCGVRVSAWARVITAPRHSWLGCWGVCASVRSPHVPRHSWLGFVVCGLRVAWHLFLCRGSLLVVRATRVCGTQWPLLLDTCLCALVVAPRWCVAPRPVRSLSVLRLAFLKPWCLSPSRVLAPPD